MSEAGMNMLTTVIAHELIVALKKDGVNIDDRLGKNASDYVRELAATVARLSEKGTAIGSEEACARLADLVDSYEHGETGATFGSKDGVTVGLVLDFLNGDDVWDVFRDVYAQPASPAKKDVS